MTRLRSLIALGGVVWISAFTVAGLGAADQYAPKPASNVPTYTKDVAPILFRNCTTCHRPGEIAPMSLLTYQDARPWAKSIRDEVADRSMPPWHADAPHGTFLNERGLTDAERETLIRWAGGGRADGRRTEDATRQRARRAERGGRVGGGGPRGRATRMTCRRRPSTSRDGRWASPTLSSRCR